MKIKSTMYYGETAIADCEWTLDDRARTTQQALAALSIEDHLRAELKIDHKIIKEEVENDESKSDVETGHSLNSAVQGGSDQEFDRVEDRTEIDERRSESDT